jgi:hypothetical protein
MNTTEYLAQIPFTVSDGIEDFPCLIGVTVFDGAKGNPNTWDSPDDYYGWEEIVFDILHPDGSVWEMMDLTKAEVRDAEKKIREHFRMQSDY